MGIRASEVVTCDTHGTSEIDLLYYEGKITLSADERVETELVGQTLPHHGSDDLLRIMVTDNPTPTPNRFILITEDLVTQVFRALFDVPNLHKAYKSICQKYADHAFQLYNKQMSLSRLYDEAFHIFMSIPTFNVTFTNFFRQYLSGKMSSLKDDMALYPHREMSIDGTQPITDKTWINHGQEKHQLDASCNATTGGGTGFVLDYKIYPQKKETHGNQCDLLINPIITSLEKSPLHEKLNYGIGIDHPIRDYGVAAELKKWITQQIYDTFEVAENGDFKTPSGLQYNINDITTFVK